MFKRGKCVVCFLISIVRSSRTGDKMKYFSTRAITQLRLNRGVGLQRTVCWLAVFLICSGMLVSPNGTDAMRASNHASPQSRWIYVLDSGGMKRESQVLLVDPEQERIIRTFKAGYYADMALSPDGTRLFLASTLRTAGGEQPILEVINTADGAVLARVDNPDRWISTIPAYPTQMAVSADGRMLYIFKDHQTLTDNTNYIATFDILAGRFLPETAALKGCITAQLFPLSNSKQLAVVCASKADVRFLNLAKNGAAISTDEEASVPSKLSLGHWSGARLGQNVGAAVVSPDGGILKVVMGDGRFVKIDTQSRKAIQTDIIDSAKRRRANNKAPLTNPVSDDWLADRWVRFQTPVFSDDGARFYLGVGRLADLREGKQWFDQIAVLDQRTFESLAVINPSRSFYSLALSKDGRRLFAIDTEGASLLVVDTGSYREIRTLRGLGVTPAFAIAAP
jgi:DNA-binding beta-propeller fold protein YncE